MSKVSVIIPVYNVEVYLRDCMDSVLNQTLTDLEVICIDDCSPDNCGMILDEYATADPRVKVIHLERNRRQGYGRNFGLDKASGQYIYFLDADDMIAPESFEELCELADKEMLDVVFFDSKDLFESEDLKKIYIPPLSLRKGVYRDEVYVGKELLDEFIRQNEWTCYPQRIFWRREFLLKEQIRYPEDTEHEDEFFAFAGILAAKRARYVRKQYFTLRTRANSVMTSGYAPKNFHGYLMNFYYMNEFVSKRDLHTYGADVNIARMIERINTLYTLLKDKYDLEQIFVKDLDKTLYRCFISWMRADDELNRIDQEVLDEISGCSEVYIYGAKLTGQRFCRKLERLSDIPIGGFLVKELDEVPSVVMGRYVRRVDEVNVPDDAIVVAAVKVMFWEETKAMFESKNIKCVFHRKL